MVATDRCVGEPPTCCHPEPLTDEQWRARGDQVKAAHAAAMARQPKACPNCGSDDIVPSFVGDTWACNDCPNVFEEDR